MRKIIRYTITYILPLLLILSLGFRFIDINCCPKLYGDEYGYWAAGAFFAGKDWNGVTSMNEYYGWGYGLILSLILRLPISSQASYALAVIVNGLMVYGVYLLAYYLYEKLSGEDYYVVRVMVSLLTACLPTTLYYTLYSLSEVVLSLIYWLLIYFEWSLASKFKNWKVIVISILNVYMLTIHMRNIGIVAVSLFYIIFCVIKFNKDNKIKSCLKSLTIASAIFIGGIWASNAIKTYYRQSIRLNYTQSRELNTIAGQSFKLQRLLSKDGVISIISNFAGRVYSMLTSSYLIAGIASVVIIASLIYCFKKRKIDGHTMWAVVCLLNTLSLIAISSVYMIGDEKGRFDILTYSRYHDFSVGPLILIGFAYLMTETNIKLKKKYAIITAVVSVVLAKYISYVMDFSLGTSHLFAHNPYHVFWSKTISDIENLYLVEIFVAIIVFALIIVVTQKWKRGIALISSLLIAVVMFESGFALKEGCLVWSYNEYVNTLSIRDYIFENEYEDSIYFLNSDKVLYVDRLQYILRDYPINVINIDMLDNLDDSSIIIQSSSGTYDFRSNGYELLFSSQQLSLWRKNEKHL